MGPFYFLDCCSCWTLIMCFNLPWTFKWNIKNGAKKLDRIPLEKFRLSILVAFEKLSCVSYKNFLTPTHLSRGIVAPDFCSCSLSGLLSVLRDWRAHQVLIRKVYSMSSKWESAMVRYIYHLLILILPSYERNWLQHSQSKINKCK